MSSKKKLTLCIGISGSGKSTFAKKQAATVIERDEIREFLYPGYWKTSPDHKKENIVTQEQERQIQAAIKADKEHIIISDTNLNDKYVSRILAFFEPAGYEVDFKYFDESLNLSLCLERNLNRERKVPSEVICRQWKAYQLAREKRDSYRFDTKNRPVIFVSDVHGLYSKLSYVINKYSTTHEIILSGDLNDQRFENLEDNFSNEVSSFESLALAFDCDTFGSVHLLHSNHQKNLINLVRNKRKKLSHGLENTAAELTWHGLVLEFDEEKTTESETWLKSSYLEGNSYLFHLISFLDTRPSCYAMTHNGQEWRFAHAFAAKEQVNFNPFPSKDELYIYGPKTDSNQRQEWWLERERSSVNFKICCGHYHTTFLGKNSIVCDPDENSTLGLVFFEEGKDPHMEIV